LILPAQSTPIKERHGASFFAFNQSPSGTLLRPALADAFSAISGHKGVPFFKVGVERLYLTTFTLSQVEYTSVSISNYSVCEGY
jgi:hypothetical protein